MFLNPLQLAPAVIVLRPNERREKASTLHSVFSKGSSNRALKTKCKSGRLYAVLSGDFYAHKILSLKFMHILQMIMELFA